VAGVKLDGFDKFDVLDELDD